MRRPSLAFALVGLSSLVACASPVERDRLAIVGGSADTGDRAVVVVAAQTSSRALYCSGVVVSPHVVLTSALCVDPSNVGAGATFAVFLGNDLNDEAQTGSAFYANVASVVSDPAFQMFMPDNGHDIGVVIVEAPLTIKPMPINRSALAQADVGASVRLVGFGDSDPMSPAPANMRRQVSTTIKSITADFVTTGDATHGTCDGDSGGPVLMTQGGQEVVVGITSSGPPNCDGPGNATNLDKYVSTFIDPRIIAADGELPHTANDLGGTTGTGDAGTTTGQSGGCSMASSRNPSYAWISILVVAAVLLRRRTTG